MLHCSFLCYTMVSALHYNSHATLQPLCYMACHLFSYVAISVHISSCQVNVSLLKFIWKCPVFILCDPKRKNKNGISQNWTCDCSSSVATSAQMLTEHIMRFKCPIFHPRDKKRFFWNRNNDFLLYRPRTIEKGSFWDSWPAKAIHC